MRDGWTLLVVNDLVVGFLSGDNTVLKTLAGRLDVDHECVWLSGAVFEIEVVENDFASGLGIDLEGESSLVLVSSSHGERVLGTLSLFVVE